MSDKKKVRHLRDYTNLKIMTGNHFGHDPTRRSLWKRDPRNKKKSGAGKEIYIPKERGQPENKSAAGVKTGAVEEVDELEGK